MAKRSGRGKIWLFLILLFGIVIFAGKTLWDSGALDTVWNHSLPNCKLRKGIRGFEDIAVIPSLNKIILSAQDRNGLASPAQNGLYSYDPTLPDQAVKQLVQGPYHGISVWPDANDPRLFAIMHKAEADHVQIFSIGAEALTLVKDVELPGVHTLNDVLALGPESFYTTQDTGFSNPIMIKLEIYLQRPLGKIWLFDGKNLSVAVDKLLYPDGLEISPDRKRIYVGSMVGRKLSSFHHKPDTHQLNQEWEKPLHTAPDNLSWSTDGRLLVAAHLDLLRLDKHSQDPVHSRAPSQVLALSGLPDQLAIDEIYSSVGDPLSASTSAVQWEKNLIMGSVFDEGFLVCDLPSSVQP